VLERVSLGSPDLTGASDLLGRIHRPTPAISATSGTLAREALGSERADR